MCLKKQLALVPGGRRIQGPSRFRAIVGCQSRDRRPARSRTNRETAEDLLASLAAGANEESTPDPDISLC